MVLMSASNEPLDLRRRNRRFGIFSLLLAVLAVWLFATDVAGLDATIRLDSSLAGGSGSQIGDLVLPVGVTAIVLGILVAFIGGVQIARGFGDRTNAWVGIAVGLFVLAFLTWAARGATLPMADLLRATVRASVPLLLGALSGVVCERSGGLNIAIEGQLLIGAFTGALIGSTASNAIAGAVAGMVAGALIGWVLAVLAIKFRTNQIVAGVVLIVFATGLTSFLNTQIFSRSPDLNAPSKFRAVEIPLLSDIPGLGPVLFHHTLLVYAALLTLVLIHYGLFYTRWGLRLRSVGEHPKAADTVGINVLRTRYQAVILGGILAGLGGAFLSLDAASQFSEQMSGGKGFIALAAMLAGRYNPRGAFGAALVFGFADALATSLQILAIGIPSTLLRTAPYVATIFVVAGLVGRLRMPAADGVAYVKE